MKKIFLLLTICFSPEIHQATTIHSTVDIGRKSKGCTGLGICSAKSTTSESEEANMAILDLSDDANILTVKIKSELITQKANQVTNARFTQEEDYQLPADLCRLLGAHSSITIPAGKYPATLSDGMYTITFTVTTLPSGTY